MAMSKYIELGTYVHWPLEEESFLILVKVEKGEVGGVPFEVKIFPLPRILSNCKLTMVLQGDYINPCLSLCVLYLYRGDLIQTHVHVTYS